MQRDDNNNNFNDDNIRNNNNNNGGGGGGSGGYVDGTYFVYMGAGSGIGDNGGWFGGK